MVFKKKKSRTHALFVTTVSVMQIGHQAQCVLEYRAPD